MFSIESVATVGELKSLLSKFPDDARVFYYDGDDDLAVYKENFEFLSVKNPSGRNLEEMGTWLNRSQS